jgi:hypothetical protein
MKWQLLVDDHGIAEHEIATRTLKQATSSARRPMCSPNQHE